MCVSPVTRTLPALLRCQARSGRGRAAGAAEGRRAPPRAAGWKREGGGGGGRGRYCLAAPKAGDTGWEGDPKPAPATEMCASVCVPQVGAAGQEAERDAGEWKGGGG